MIAFRVGIAGPVGSVKTALLDALCKVLRQQHGIAVVTNDISTQEDAPFLVRSQALESDRIFLKTQKGLLSVVEFIKLNIAEP